MFDLIFEDTNEYSVEMGILSRGWRNLKDSQMNNMQREIAWMHISVSCKS